MNRSATRLRKQGRAIGALILRDMRTRFGGSPVTYLFAVFWPVAHVAVILAVYSLTGRQASFGTDALIWLTTGTLPFVIFLYPARQVMVALLENRPLLAFPGVTAADIMTARAALEAVTGIAVAFAVYAGLRAAGYELVFRDLPHVLAALALALVLGVGAGLVNGVAAMLNPRWQTMANLLFVAIWATCGILYLIDGVPEPYRSMLALNPLVHVIELFREGFYPDYRSATLDLSYLGACVLGLLLAGLAGERMLRARLVRA